jgi:hypothetical protein
MIYSIHITNGPLKALILVHSTLPTHSLQMPSVDLIKTCPNSFKRVALPFPHPSQMALLDMTVRIVTASPGLRSFRAMQMGIEVVSWQRYGFISSLANSDLQHLLVQPCK